MARPRGYRLSQPAWADALRSAGLTITQAAERANIPRPTVSAIIGGHSRASETTANALANALGVDRATLFPTFLDWLEEVAA